MRLLSSLTNRIFLAAAVLAVLSIAIAIFLVNAAVTRQAEEALNSSLEDAFALMEQYRGALFEHFIREARLVADLPKLKAAVFEDHPPTAQPIAEDYQRQIGSDLFLVTNARGHVLAQIGASNYGDLDLATRPAVRSALEGRAATIFRARAGEILQVVAVPVWIDPTLPEILGTLTVGFSLNRQMAEQFKRLTNTEVAFAMAGEIEAGTLDDRHWRTLASLLDASGVTTVGIDDEEYVAMVQPLASTAPSVPLDSDAPQQSPPRGAGPLAVMLRSRTAALQFLRPLQTALAGTALVAVLAATLLSYGVARTVTRPLDAITSTMREIAATGDLTRRIEPKRAWMDEDTRLLAGTFNGLTESIARFQREATQRERLSSLGRLSTVIAHEIRNPLMIIKTSLLALKREGATAAQIDRSAESIDEEVSRLNRIVSEVLDFARPIRFEYGEDDVNRLCADAAAAATATDDEAPGIRLQLAA